jgi:CheY-like chemotaxis protein
VPAVAVRLSGGKYNRECALREGFKAYLTKPVDPWQLCRVAKDQGLYFPYNQGGPAGVKYCGRRDAIRR